MEIPFKRFIDFFAERQKKETENDIALAEAIKKDLEQKLPQIVDYFDDYAQWSVEHLVEDYAFMRHRFMKSAEYYIKQAEDIQMEYRHEAGELLKYILNKKLFNAECLWRAGKQELPGIETTHDFHRWEDDLFHCPFINPVTQQEVDMLVSYLEQHPEEAVVREYHYNWQNYPYLKMSWCEEEEIELQEFYQTYACILPMSDTGVPQWYRYYDNIMGSTGLLSLPDVKFPKEVEYRRLYTKHKKEEEIKQLKKEGKEPPPPPVYQERKPTLALEYGRDRALEEIVENFESKEMQKLYKAYVLVEKTEAGIGYEDEETDEDSEVAELDMEYKEPSASQIKEAMEEALYGLKDAREPVPIEANVDWRVAVISAYRKHKIGKIIAAIPAAHNDYLMRLETGIGFETPEETELPEYMLDAKKQILAGRKLAGEPEDYNY